MGASFVPLMPVWSLVAGHSGMVLPAELGKL